MSRSVAEVSTSISRNIDLGLHVAVTDHAVATLDWKVLSEFMAEVQERTAEEGVDPHVCICFGKRPDGMSHATIGASWHRKERQDPGDQRCVMVGCEVRGAHDHTGEIAASFHQRWPTDEREAG